VLEIGCGDGELSRDWNEAATRRGYSPHYLRADLSPELLNTQRTAAPGTFGVQADAVALPFPDSSFDLIISNEVIADLKAAPYPLSGASKQLESAIESRIHRYDLRFDEGPALVNIGAWMMLEELCRVLKPGGFGWVSEFGDLVSEPEQATQLDHPETSIHFGRLLQVAHSLGLEACCVPLGDFLQLDYQAEQLSRGSWHALRALARAEALHLPARAWTPATLQGQLPMALNGLRWVPMWDEGPGPLISRFLALIIRKPKRPAN
jgi:SAM-dependent methyltransferase